MTPQNSDDEATKMTSVSSACVNSMTKCENETNAIEMSTRVFDKTKLEHFILSMSLNKRLITYDKNLKIILTLKSSPWWFSREKECRHNVIKSIEWKAPAGDEILVEKPKNIQFNDDVSDEFREKIISKVDSEIVQSGDDSQIEEISENIYESIWKCTESQQVNDDETKNYCTSEYNNDWEIDSEFSFKATRDQFKMPFSDVIIYSKDVPSNDKICVASTPTYNPVENWKNILKTVNYAHDEEEMVRSLQVIFSRLFLIAQ